MASTESVATMAAATAARRSGRGANIAKQVDARRINHDAAARRILAADNDCEYRPLDAVWTHPSTGAKL